MIPKICCAVLFSCMILISRAQPIWPFKDYAIDTSVKFISIANKRTVVDGSSRYNFYLNDVGEMNTIKKYWKLKNFHAYNNIQLEDSFVTIRVIKGKQQIGDLLIFPQQKIALGKGGWYDFDMDALLATARRHPLQCHAQYFRFENYAEYTFFEDSIETAPDFMFLSKPGPITYPGYFDLFVKKGAGTAPEVNALEAINKEIPERYFTTKFLATVIVRDTTTGIQPDEVRIRIDCSKELYEKISRNDARKTAWTPHLYETRVYFKD